MPLLNLLLAALLPVAGVLSSLLGIGHPLWAMPGVRTAGGAGALCLQHLGADLRPRPGLGLLAGPAGAAGGPAGGAAARPGRRGLRADARLDGRGPAHPQWLAPAGHHARPAGGRAAGLSRAVAAAGGHRRLALDRPAAVRPARRLDLGRGGGEPLGRRRGRGLRAGSASPPASSPWAWCWSPPGSPPPSCAATAATAGTPAPCSGPWPPSSWPSSPPARRTMPSPWSPAWAWSMVAVASLLAGRQPARGYPG